MPAVRLATTASHVEEIRRFVRSVHLTIYARNEEDVELSNITKQLACLNISNTLPEKLSVSNNEVKLLFPISLPKAVSLQSSQSTIANTKKSGTNTNNSSPWMPPAPTQIQHKISKPENEVDLDERAKFWNEVNLNK